MGGWSFGGGGGGGFRGFSVSPGGGGGGGGTPLTCGECMPEMIDVRQPVNYRAPLNAGLRHWWLPIRPFVGGVMIKDLCGRNDGFSTTGVNRQLFDEDWFFGGGGGGNLWATHHGNTIFDAFALDDDFTGFISDRSIAAWIRLDNTASSHTVISKFMNTGSNGEWTLFVENSGDTFRYFVRSADGDIDVRSSALLVDTWYHVVVTHEIGVAVEMYVNGQSDKASTVNETSGLISATEQAYLGRNQGTTSNSSSRQLTGDLTDVRFYDRILTSGEAAALHRASKHGYRHELNRQSLHLSPMKIAG